MKKGLIFALAGSMLFLASCGETPTMAPESSAEAPSTTAVANYDDEVDVIEAAQVYEHNKKLEEKVPDHFTERPVYALSENATEDEVRQMVIQAMYNQITFPWTPEQDFAYTKTIGVSRSYDYKTYTPYAGNPYSSAALSMFHALEYYDYSNGILHGFDWNHISDLFGNSCAAAVNWALAAVCPNFNAVSSSSLTPVYGYATLDGLTFPEGIREWNGGVNDTAQVVHGVEEQAMMEIYASIKPGDVIAKVGSDDEGHVMMVYKEPVVVRNADGTINPKESKAIIIDQWSSQRVIKVGEGYYTTCGRYDIEYTFEEYYTKGYMPFRAAFLADYKGYEKAYVKTDKEITSIDEIANTKMETNFRVVKYEGALISESGKTIYLKKSITSRDLYPNGKDRNCKLSKAAPKVDDLKAVMVEGRKYTYEVRVLVSTGELLTVCQIPLTLENLK